MATTPFNGDDGTVTLTATTPLPEGALEVLSTAGVINVTSSSNGDVHSSSNKRKKDPHVPHAVVIRLDLPKALALCANSDDLPPPRRRAARALHGLVSALFGGASSTSGRPFEADDVYDRLREHVDAQPARPSAPLPPLPALRPTLRRYQRDAVEWALAREGCATSATTSPSDDTLWRCVSCDDGTPLYWNTANGALSASAPSPSAASSTPPVSGGILADEMGLGKSVEVIAT